MSITELKRPETKPTSPYMAELSTPPSNDVSQVPPGIRRDISVQSFIKEGKPFPTAS